MFNIMNIDNINFEEFKKYYQYLVYIKHNIGKYILTDTNYVNFMTEQHKIYPDVKVNQNKLYYHNLMNDIIQRFEIYEKNIQKLFIKLNLTFDIQITYEKICKYFSVASLLAPYTTFGLVGWFSLILFFVGVPYTISVDTKAILFACIFSIAVNIFFVPPIFNSLNQLALLVL